MRYGWMVFALAVGLILQACGGGSSASSTTGGTGLPGLSGVSSLSYSNFKNVGLTPQVLPSGRSGPGTVRGYADFSGNGRLDLFAATLTYSPSTSTPATATPSIFEFWRKQSDGSFVLDSQLLTSSSGCIHPRKAVVADFNGDQRPDVFVACHGYDASPFPGEKNKIVLSQSNGRYVIQDASVDIGFHHSGSAVDLDGDGDVDVVVTNNFDPASAYVLLNQGNGTFVREGGASRLPAAIAGPKNYFSVELLDVDEDGKADLVMGGHDWEGAPTVVLINPGNNDFSAVTPVTVPAVANEGVVLDFAATGTGASRALWVLRTSGGDGTFYQSRTIQKVAWPGLVSTTVLNDRPAQWFPWLLPANISGQAVMVSDDSTVGVSVAQ